MECYWYQLPGVRCPGSEASGAGEKWGEGTMALLTLSSTLAGGALHVCRPTADQPPYSSGESAAAGECSCRGEALPSQMQASNQERTALPLAATVPESPSRSDQEEGLEELVQDGLLWGGPGTAYPVICQKPALRGEEEECGVLGV